MDKKIKESVATLFAHIIKADQRELKKEAPLFCDLLGEDFACNREEAESFLVDFMDREHDMDKHVAIIKEALCNDRISKFHLMEQLNKIICSDKIKPEDYDFFEKIRNELFASD